MVDGTGSGRRRVAEVTGDGGGGEKLREQQHVELDEDAAQRERQELRAQQRVGVDGSAPGLADAAGRGEAARSQAAEHVREQSISSGSCCTWLLSLISSCSCCSMWWCFALLLAAVSCRQAEGCFK